MDKEENAVIEKINPEFWSDSSDWQVVFITNAGLDYCRETFPAHCSLEWIEARVKSLCALHGLKGARIERW